MALGESLFAIGGLYLDSVEVYSPVTGTWQALRGVAIPDQAWFTAYALIPPG